MTYIQSLQESDQMFLGFAYLCPYKYFLHHNHAKKGFYKEFVQQESFVPILQIIGTYKTDI